MRFTTRALLSMLLVVGYCQSALAESSVWRLWPFGGEEEASSETSAPSVAAPTYTPSPGLSPSTDITPIGPQSALHHAHSTELPQTPPDSDRPPLLTSPFAKLKWPKVPTPEWPTLRARSSHNDAAASNSDRLRNAWVQKAPEPQKPTPMQALSDGAHRVGERTRAAWLRAVNVLTPGKPDPRTPPRLAQRSSQPPFWKRMFGAQPEPQGPQTIQGFIAQERLDP
jgi:hypothetical protein